ncbi:ZrgA family zinc uptake protein [Microbulbifer harenosus]|uniref:DUF2796 domain-containing protein n=1 Tax=Microbulbifer harenosus TaxID=2576840 RepID=A0ABY2UJ29_9GAMM|nr:DUF2796 domain-containing protein [Microbulbifer harenosus]
MWCARVDVPLAGRGLGGHASFRVSYRFQCDNLAQLSGVNMALFLSFPDIHEIKVQWLTPERQGATTLTAQHNQLQLK